MNTDFDSPERLRPKLAKAGVVWPNVALGGPDSIVAVEWWINAYPSKIIIDQDGIVRANQFKRSEWSRTLEALLAK